MELVGDRRSLAGDADEASGAAGQLPGGKDPGQVALDAQARDAERLERADRELAADAEAREEAQARAERDRGLDRFGASELEIAPAGAARAARPLECDQPRNRAAAATPTSACFSHGPPG